VPLSFPRFSALAVAVASFPLWCDGYRAECCSVPSVPKVLHASAALENLGASLNVECSLVCKLSRHARQCKTGRALTLSGSVQFPSLPLLTPLHLHADLATQGPQVQDQVKHPHQVSYPAEACTITSSTTSYCTA
jgi:hypothetical protein